jgi:hypothetical protein
MRCIYEVPRIILLQIFLYTYSLVSGATFNVVHLSSHTLSPVMLPLLETLWNPSFKTTFNAAVIFFWGSSMSRTVINLKRTKSQREPNQRIQGMFQPNNRFHFAIHSLTECSATQSIVMIQKPAVGPGFRPFWHTPSCSPTNISYLSSAACLVLSEQIILDTFQHFHQICANHIYSV